MFDIGFFELILVAIVGLVVIGPERLPDTVRTVSLWVGRIKRSLRETRAELEKQIGADEIRRQLHNEELMRSLNSTREEIERVMNEDPIEEPDVHPSHFQNDGKEPSAADKLEPSAVDQLEPSAADQLKPSAVDQLKPSAPHDSEPSSTDQLDPTANTQPKPAADNNPLS